MLFAHAFVLASGDETTAPLRVLLDRTPGGMAVDIFFSISGFLVGASLMTRDLVSFVQARVLRIYPGLLVMVMVTVLCLGPAITTLPLGAYIADGGILAYVARCGTLFFGVVYELPGVFADPPYPRVVNGSLWTMPIEVKMYALLAATWLVSLVSKAHRTRLFELAILAIAGLALAGLVIKTGLGRSSDLERLVWMFFGGASLFVFGRHVALDTRVTTGLAVAMCVAPLVGTRLFNLVYDMEIPYLVIYAAYVPGGLLRGFNKFDDYSYGMYIYAFPIQQLLVSLQPGLSGLVLFGQSAVATLAFAVLSRKFVEGPALALKWSKA